MTRRHLADRLVAAVLMVFGAAQFWGGFTMDRLEIRKIHPASIPGLLPMFLGVAMFVLALIVYRVGTSPDSSGEVDDDAFSAAELRRFIGVSLLAGVYALVLVGHLHFWLASALFVFSFIAVTEYTRLSDSVARWRVLPLTLLVAVVVTGAITVLFEKGFLVRLP